MSCAENRSLLSAMPAIYLHSVRRDFADTQRVPEAAYLGRRLRRSSLKLLVCGCAQPRLVRICRSAWMRPIVFLRHYLCRGCGDRVLRPKIRERAVYSAVYLPAQPANFELARTLRNHYARLFQHASASSRQELRWQR